MHTHTWWRHGIDLLCRQVSLSYQITVDFRSLSRRVISCQSVKSPRPWFVDAIHWSYSSSTNNIKTAGWFVLRRLQEVSTYVSMMIQCIFYESAKGFVKEDFVPAVLHLVKIIMPYMMNDFVCCAMKRKIRERITVAFNILLASFWMCPWVVLSDKRISPSFSSNQDEWIAHVSTKKSQMTVSCVPLFLNWSMYFINLCFCISFGSIICRRGTWIGRSF